MTPSRTEKGKTNMKASKADCAVEVNLLRRTNGYTATRTKQGVRIIARERDVTPPSRVVSMATWNALERMDDRSFDGSCVLELGIGAFRKAPSLQADYFRKNRKQ